jgi:methyltransferase family protein
MWRFWDYVIEPVLTAAGASTVVEIGAAGGRNTRRLGRWAARNGAVVHVIDPEPRFDPEALERTFPEAFVMHRSPSLGVLPGIAEPDAALIDGDHNWYTVTEELRSLERGGSQWPVTFLHDVGWPYGRRDMYYDAERIPPEHRHPHERSGIVVGRSDLTPEGVNGKYANATHEGGPRNGVLTAVEDFMDESGHRLELFAFRGWSGLALLLDRDHMETGVGRLAEVLHDQTFALELSPRHASRFFDQ